MEILRSAVKLLLIILLILIGSKVLYKDNFAVVTGEFYGDNTDTAKANIPYPNGFNKDNSIIVAVNLRKRDDRGFSNGATFDSAAYMAGALPCELLLGDSEMYLRMRNIILANEEPVLTSNISTENKMTYRIVLMKI